MEEVEVRRAEFDLPSRPFHSLPLCLSPCPRSPNTTSATLHSPPHTDPASRASHSTLESSHVSTRPLLQTCDSNPPNHCLPPTLLSQPTPNPDTWARNFNLEVLSASLFGVVNSTAPVYDTSFAQFESWAFCNP
eukprot:3122044-Rhodomonas_salina.1